MKPFEGLVARGPSSAKQRLRQDLQTCRACSIDLSTLPGFPVPRLDILARLLGLEVSWMGMEGRLALPNRAETFEFQA